MDNVLLAGSQRATPRVSRSSHDTHVERWIAWASEMTSVYARERWPVPHSESVRTRFHISHNRLAAEPGTVERSFLAVPISPRPFWYPMWSLILPVCSGHILVARIEIEIFWYDLTIRSTFRGGHCRIVRFIKHKSSFLRGWTIQITICGDIIIKSFYIFDLLNWSYDCPK